MIRPGREAQTLKRLRRFDDRRSNHAEPEPRRDALLHRQGFAVGNRFLSLGVVSEVLVSHQDNAVQFVPIPTNIVPVVRSHQMVDLGVVYKSRVVLEAVTECVKAAGEI
jgi:hypothetical protein